MMPDTFNVGAFVRGAPTSPRVLVRHADLLSAYADGLMLERDETREAYLSHFAFGPELQAHYAANRQSVAGFAGPCWARWVVLDIDRTDLADALTDARRLVAFLRERYPEADNAPVYFSGGKGFHVLIELAHKPPPAVGFQRTARTLAETLAGWAGVKIDTGIYDVNHIVRLPNTRHPKTGLFKRRIDTEALFTLSIDGIRRHAAHEAGDGIPTVRTVPPQLVDDWCAAEAAVARAAEARAERRSACAGTPDQRAPRYFLDLLRFGVDEGERHKTLFRCAAWLTEQGAPPPLVSALLAEPGADVGLAPKDVTRQICCGIEHARRQRAADPMPDPDDYEACERWCIQHEGDSLPPGALDFPGDAKVTEPAVPQGPSPRWIIDPWATLAPGLGFGEGCKLVAKPLETR